MSLIFIIIEKLGQLPDDLWIPFIEVVQSAADLPGHGLTFYEARFAGNVEVFPAQQLILVNTLYVAQ